MANADVISFYKSSLDTLQYDKAYSLYEKANKNAQNGVNLNRYANFALDATYSNTKAKTLPNMFDTTDIAFSDALDLFGKGSYKIEELALDLNAKKTLLNLQKEQLFISLVDMLALYHETKEKLSLHKELFNEQRLIYKKLKILQEKGSIMSIDALRFKNTLTSLKTKIISEKSQIIKMEKQLNLYAPEEKIPNLDSTKLFYSKEDFLVHNPLKRLNDIEADRLNTQAKNLNNAYLPDITAGVAYQQLGDPTGYGDNYSFNIGIHMPISIGDFKQAQALKSQALSKKSQTVKYELQRKNQYTKIYQDYISASKQLQVLNDSLPDYEKSEKTIKIAFLKQYVDFNTYLQVLTDSLSKKEQILVLKYRKIANAVILNSISSGVIYE
jgi:hypothetical protein